MKKQFMINSSSSTTSGKESIMHGSSGNNASIDNDQRDLTIVSSPLFVEMLYGRSIDNGSIGDYNMNISVEDQSDDDDEDENDGEDTALDEEKDDGDASDDIDGKMANDVRNSPSLSSSTTTSKDAIKVTSITERESYKLSNHT